MGKEYLREEMMFGETALKKLQQSHVAVFGIGGVGSYSAEALARAGVGRLTLVDNDTVSITNINRQLCALHSTVGQNKSDVMAQRILDINPECRVRSLVRSYTEGDKEFFFTEHYDYIIDAIDTVSCKLSLIENAINRDIPIISAMGTGNKLDPTKFVVTDLAKTDTCPLARVLRQRLRKKGIDHLQVVYSTEPPLTPLETIADGGRKQLPGSVSFVPSAAGLVAAGAVIRALTEK